MRIKRHTLAAVALLAAMVTGMRVSAKGNDKLPDDLIARIHFMGTGQIAADKNALKLNEIRTFRESDALWNEIVQKLATAPFRVMNKNSTPRKNDHADLMRPIVEDVLRSESYVEIRGTTNLWPEVAIATRVDHRRAELWKSNLTKALSDWTGISVAGIQMEGFKGWELKKHHNPNLFRFFEAGDWVVFGWGEDELKLQPAMLEKIKENKRPVLADTEHWLTAWMDWPAFESHHPMVLPVQLPKMDLTVDVHPDFLRPELKLEFAEPLGIKIEPWKFPTNLVSQPLSSITMARGFGPLLGKLPAVKDMNAEPPPDQIVLWASQQLDFLTCWAAPVNEGQNYLLKIAPGLISFVNSTLRERNAAGKATLTTNMSIAISGVPMISPFLRATNGPDGDYLAGGMMAIPPLAAPFPWQALESVISSDTVVYYDWENNGNRFSQLRVLSQLYFMSTQRTLPRLDTPAENWLMAVKSKLGECRTVGKLTAPNEITLIRNAPIGFTGFELTCLALWVDGPDFPIEEGFSKANSVNVRPPGR